MQKIGVNGERRFATLIFCNRDLVLFCKSDQRFAAFEVPLAPGRDDFNVGLKRIITELEAHLIIALAGGAM